VYEAILSWIRKVLWGFALILAAETFVQSFIDDERLIVGFEESFDFLIAEFLPRTFFKVNPILKRENSVNSAYETKQERDDNQMGFLHVVASSICGLQYLLRETIFKITRVISCVRLFSLYH
jgi:hypothetical protein